MVIFPAFSASVAGATTISAIQSCNLYCSMANWAAKINPPKAACTKNKIGIMGRGMLSFAHAQKQIFRVIILSVAVYMMNDFSWYQTAAQHFLHHQNSAGDISSMSPRMTGKPDKYSSIFYELTSFPLRSCRAENTWGCLLFISWLFSMAAQNCQDMPCRTRKSSCKRIGAIALFGKIQGNNLFFRFSFKFS